MEYSLQQINKLANYKNLDVNTFVETLNLIGLEVDEIFIDKLEEKSTINDIRIEIKIPANREDLLSEMIFIEELATVFLLNLYETWKNLKKEYFFLLKKNYFQYSSYSINLIDSEFQDILTYAIKINSYDTVEVPKWISKKLNKVDLKANNLIESLIELTIFEWGQNYNSLFDNNNKLIIKRSQTDDFILINNDKYFIPKGSILLKNSEDKILSILGLINHNIVTKSFVLEASFYNIEKNILELNDINTKLSFRYLRKCFLNNFKYSFQRLLTLIEIISNGVIDKKIYKTTNRNFDLNHYKLLKVNKNIFQKILNIPNYDNNILTRANIKLVCSTLNELYFRIPYYRTDLTREIDLIEEYTRFIGYKNFKEILPQSYISNFPSKNSYINFIKQFFILNNFNEVFTNSLISELKIEESTIFLKNPLNKDLSILRSSLIPNLLDIFLKNIQFVSNYSKFFEIGRIYKQNDSKIVEEEYLSLIFPIENELNSKLTWFKAKGFIEYFLSFFGNKNFIFEKSDVTKNYYHPKKTIIVQENKKIIGIFGEIHPKYRKMYSLKQNIYLFELNLNSVNSKNLESNLKISKEYSKYPSITKDLSLTISKNINFSELRELIRNSLEDLKHFEFFDIYPDENSFENISIGIRLEFQSYTKTLLTDEIELKINNLLILLKNNYKINLKF